MITAEEEYAKNPELSKEDVRSLQEWLEKQPHLPRLSEVEIIFFLQSCRFSMEVAKNAIDNYYTIRTTTPEIFGNHDPLDPEFQKSVNMSCIAILPQRTKDGCAVSVGRLIDTNPEVYVFTHQIKFFDMIYCLHLHTEGTSKGFHAIFDMHGAALGHLTRVSLTHLKKSLFYVQEALPIRLIGIHYVNATSFVDKLIALTKPFMNKELLNLLHVHTSMDTLYEFVPKEILPKEYGGYGETFAELHERTKKQLQDNVEFFQQENLKRSDESKRVENPGGKSSSPFLTMEGSFKKLEVD